MFASDISPGRKGEPPPTSPANVAEWCGLRNGRTPPRIGSTSSPATECTTAVSMASASDSGGRMDGSLDASMVLPEPGGPVISTPWPPAAAICKARFAMSWPAMSRKSSAGALLGFAAPATAGNRPVLNPASDFAARRTNPSSATKPWSTGAHTRSTPNRCAHSA